MSQESILKELQRKPDKWWSARDLCEKTGLGFSTVTKNLYRLRKFNCVEHEQAYRKGYWGMSRYLVYKHKGDSR